MNNKIILEPRAGLANRMRVIASGLWLASVTNKKIELIWDLTPGLNCSFEKLFEPVENITIVKKKLPYRFFRTPKQENIIKRLIRKSIKFIVGRNFIVIDDSDVKKIRKGEKNILTISKKNKHIYFRTCQEFGNNTNKLKLFIPKPDIQKRINGLSSKFSNKTIGIHIRRTDHSKAIDKSPTELFIKRIKNDLEGDSEINYYLSTDDPHTEKQIISIFGEKIITHKKEYSRNSERGIMDAVVDLYCLANTSKIYGSYWSSFSGIASRINNIEKILVIN